MLTIKTRLKTGFCCIIAFILVFFLLFPTPHHHITPIKQANAVVPVAAVAIPAVAFASVAIPLGLLISGSDFNEFVNDAQAAYNAFNLWCKETDKAYTSQQLDSIFNESINQQSAIISLQNVGSDLIRTIETWLHSLTYSANNSASISGGSASVTFSYNGYNCTIKLTDNVLESLGCSSSQISSCNIVPQIGAYVEQSNGWNGYYISNSITKMNFRTNMFGINCSSTMHVEYNKWQWRSESGYYFFTNESTSAYGIKLSFLLDDTRVPVYNDNVYLGLYQNGTFEPAQGSTATVVYDSGVSPGYAMTTSGEMSADELISGNNVLTLPQDLNYDDGWTTDDGIESVGAVAGTGTTFPQVEELPWYTGLINTLTNAVTGISDAVSAALTGGFILDTTPVTLATVTTSFQPTLDKFPFCIPSDILALVNRFSASPDAPSVTWPVKVDGVIDTSLTVDLDGWDSVAFVTRTLSVVFMLFGLLKLTKFVSQTIRLSRQV